MKRVCELGILAGMWEELVIKIKCEARLPRDEFISSCNILLDLLDDLKCC